MEHPADIASLLRTDAYDGRRLTPVVAPGSFEEQDALALIDASRAEEQAHLEETPADRARSRTAYWRSRGGRS